jgi:ATP-binding cassette subfamily B protein
MLTAAQFLWTASMSVTGIKQELRRHLGLVLQDVFLFSGDFATNITLGDPHIPEERMLDAGRRAQIAPLIERWPEGYHQEVQERGSTLSQGQRQLLSFARALAFDPKILILDEATSSVDTRTETLIQKALDELLENRTALIIAHRLSTIKNADRILVVHKGEIWEEGRHSELLARGGLYARLYELQYQSQDRFGQVPSIRAIRRRFRRSDRSNRERGNPERFYAHRVALNGV